MEGQMKDSGERQQFTTGAVRDTATGKPRPDLISPHANLREGAWLALGAQKYAVDNWTKGIPIRRCFESLMRHAEAYKLGLRDEDHMAAIRTNAGFILHYEEEIKAGRLDAGLDDMPHYFDRGRVTITGGSKLERKIQAKLDETFANPQTIYAVGNIRRGDQFCIVDGHAYRSASDIPSAASAIVTEGYAYEDIPDGAPMRITGKVPKNGGVWEIALGTTRIGPNGREVYMKPVPPSMTLGVGLASGPDQTVVSMVEGTSERMSSAKEAEILELNAARRQRVAADPAPFTVYLCGPITGQDVDYLWRQAATAMLQAHGIRTLDPLRGKHKDQISNLGLGYRGQLAAPEIADRDQMDIDDADVILAHFPYDPPRQSVGSLMEIGMAVKAGKTVILCSAVPVFNEHLFCRNFTTIEPNFEQALNRIVAMATAKRR